MKKGKFPKKIFKKKTYCIIAVAAVLAAGSTAFAVSVRAKNVQKSSAKASVQSTAVTKGSISNTIDASGNLEASELIDITVPTRIKVDEIKVESGEEVKKGQTLAKLNKTSVTRLLVEVKDSLEDIDDELEKSGLSSLEKEELEGEKSEFEETEKKLTALYKKPVITASADGIIGNIYIFANTETSNSSVSAGSGSSDSSTGINTSLSQLSSENTVNTENTESKTSGLLFLTADIKTSSSGDSDSKQEDTSNASDNSDSEQTDTSKNSDSQTDAPDNSDDKQTNASDNSDDKQTNASDNSDGKQTDTPDDSADTSDKTDQPKTITDYSALAIQTPEAGAAPQKSIKETASYTGTISWNCSSGVFQNGTAYTATIILTAKSGYTFSEKNLPIIKDASFNWNINRSGEGNTLTIAAKYEKTADVPASQGNSSAQPSSGSSSENNSSGTTDNSSGQPAGSAAGMGSGNTARSMTGMGSGSTSGGMTGSSSGSASGSSGAASGSVTSASSSEYSNYETAAFTIAGQDTAKIVVNVDELDILSVEKDQDAIVTLDALENEEYTGTVTKISNTASAGNGSTKYEVEITVPMDENMRIGMSASAAIQISSSEDTLLLPMAALQQRGDETFVYTEKDTDGNLSGAVTVETGLSDGQNVEIRNGLTEGTEVYYTRAVSDNAGTFETGGMFPGGMGGMGGSGEMPTPPDGGGKRPDSDGSRGRNGENDSRGNGGKPSGN